MHQDSAIALGFIQQCAADKLLIEDKREHRVAKINSISTIGSFGILLAAKQACLIDQVLPYVAKIQSSDIYLSADLIVIGD